MSTRKADNFLNKRNKHGSVHSDLSGRKMSLIPTEFQMEVPLQHFQVTRYPYEPKNIQTFPMKADEPPRRAIPTATLAGAPPGAFLNAGASASESPLVVGTKSISISPKQTTSEESSFTSGPLSLANAFPARVIAVYRHQIFE